MDETVVQAMAMGEKIVVLTQCFAMVCGKYDEAVFVNAQIFKRLNQSSEMQIPVSYFTIILSDVIMVFVIVI